MPRRKVHPVSPATDASCPGSETSGPVAIRAGGGTLSTANAVRTKRLRQHTEERLARYLLIRSKEPDLNNRQIAERLGVGYTTLRDTLYQATRRGILKFDSPLDKFKYETLPKVVDGLDELVTAKDKQAIIETAKATIFKQFVSEEGIVEQPQLALGLKIEMVPIDPSTKPADAHIIGKGREVKAFLEGQTVE